MNQERPSERTTLAERRGQDYTVYQPAEDSALLASEVEAEVTGHDPRLVLDVGTGSGYVGERLIEATDGRVVGVDVNADACRQAAERGVEAVIGDLVSAFADDTFDVVTFNPPYLPAMAQADWVDAFGVAVTGGPTGREVIDRFIDTVGRVLTDDGVVYLLVSSLTGVPTVVDHAVSAGYSVAAVADVSYPGETLSVLKLW